MPIYEYRCENCDYHFDKLQKISDDPLKECPKCQAPALKKLISAAGFQLKGDGWYVTDFKDKKKSGEGANNTAADSNAAPKKTAGETKKSSD